MAVTHCIRLLPSKGYRKDCTEQVIESSKAASNDNTTQMITQADV